MSGDHYSPIEKKLSTVSSCFCLAKWTGVTLHLESGTTHSCHHPNVHPVPLEELKANPSALHNTKYKIEQRKRMMHGVRPVECDYCWRVEDLKTNEVSDRMIKSGAEWSLPHFDAIVKDPYNVKFKPKYVEVSFSNKCQFKCSYCSANYSSAWEDELAKFGNYSTYSGMKLAKIIPEEDNPYVEAFWKWWPELKKDISTFRITGGEPLLSPSTFKVLESLKEQPEPGMNIAINSNLGAPPVLITKFTNLVTELMNAKAINSLELYTSIDAFGAHAEYIRNGLNHEKFWSNMELFLENNPATKVTIMCTFNALSVLSFIPLLQKIMEINLKHRNEERKLPVFIDISFLRDPDYQSVFVLPESFIPKMEEIVNFIQDNQWYKTPDHVGFHDSQVIKSKRILEMMKQGMDIGKQTMLKKKFYDFFLEHDKRRSTNFLETFPEFSEFWNECKHISAMASV